MVIFFPDSLSVNFTRFHGGFSVLRDGLIILGSLRDRDVVKKEKNRTNISGAVVF